MKAIQVVMQREREKQMTKGKAAMANAGNDPFAAHAALLNADGERMRCYFVLLCMS